MMDRRTFLGALPVSTATLAALHRQPPLERSRPDSGVLEGGEDLAGWGVQLYTLRSLLDDDLEGVLASVAGMGYSEVELFQLHGRTPADMRAILDGVGLRATSNHYGLEALEGDLERTLDGAHTLGQRLMVVPSIPASRRTDEGLLRVAETLNRAGERIRRAGLRLGYHNHDWELRPLSDGRRPIDLLLDETEADLVDWQMDIFWTVHGGGDPLTMLGERPGRVTSVHVKDRTAAGEMVTVGEGVIDFGTILSAAEQDAMTHAYVEHDRPDEPLTSVRRSLRHLQTLGVGG